MDCTLYVLIIVRRAQERLKSEFFFDSVLRNSYDSIIERDGLLCPVLSFLLDNCGEAAMISHVSYSSFVLRVSLSYLKSSP